jgi:hypothetical protein
MTEYGNRQRGSDRLFHPHDPDDETTGAGIAGAAGSGAFPDGLWNAGTVAAPMQEAALAAGVGSWRQIVFIEGNVPDAEALATGVAPGVLAVILDPNQDGLQQIAAFLTRHGVAGLQAIDIVAHGADGEVSLGTAMLSADTVSGYKSQLATIGSALQAGGDLQIYGCDVAQDAAGTAFLQQLSAATGGANVAAASHLVGSAAGGGSWTLDVNTGAIDASTPFTATAIGGFTGELALSPDSLFAAFDVGVSTRDNGVYNGFGGNVRIEKMTVTGAVASGTVDVRDGTQSGGATLSGYEGLNGLVVDAPLGRYFAVNSDYTYYNQIIYGNVTGGNPTVLKDFGTTSGWQLWGPTANCITPPITIPRR